MHAGRAVLAGLAGGLAMTVLSGVARAIWLPIDLETILGTMFFADGARAWLAGRALFLILAAAIGVIYALAFERLTHRADARTGALFSIAHMAIVGLLLALIPAIHPRMPELVPAPGAFMSAMGFVGVALFVIEHLVYGAIVGAVYGEVTDPRARTVPRAKLRYGST